MNGRRDGRPAAGSLPASVPVRVKPGSSRTAVGGGYEGPYGLAVVVTVGPPAIDGRATEAALRALADALGVKYRQLTVRAGATSRDKLIEVADPPDDLPTRLDALRGARAPR
jgi:uncharacterized protein YggU (UPF0235/DUF167 family)